MDVTVLLYMKDGNVPIEDQCQRASHFLQGKAAQVYEQEIALHSSQSTVVFQPIFVQKFRCRFKDCDKVKKPFKSTSTNYTSCTPCWRMNLTAIRLSNSGKDSIRTYKKASTPNDIIKR